MTPRLVPATLLAVAIALVPGAASAAPEPPAAPVSVSTWTSSYATAEVELSDGRTAQVTLGRYRAAVRDPWQGQLSLYLQAPCTGWHCPPMVSGSVSLDGDQVQFDRLLDSASVTDLPLVLESWQWGPNGPVRTEIPVTVSADFTGTGPLTRDVYGGDVCGPGDPCPHSQRRDVRRSATVALTVDDLTATGTGSMSTGWALDVLRAPVDSAG